MRKSELIIYNKAIEVLKKFPSGEKFFDELDKQLSESVDIGIYLDLFKMIPENHFIVLSGGFGKKVSILIDEGTLPYKNYFLFIGGIRKGAEPLLIKKEIKSGNLKNGIFLDDSIYGGLTYETLKKVFAPDVLCKCAVIYDGCPIKKNDISSIFRYYDHFPYTESNFKFVSEKHNMLLNKSIVS
jgi:hypothetical protein